MSEQKPKREKLTVPFELKTYYGPQGRNVYGLYPIDGTTPPRFQGKVILTTKKTGPLPQSSAPYEFDIVDATTPAEAFAQFDAAMQPNLADAVARLNAQWVEERKIEEYRRMAMGGPGAMGPPGLVDAAGMPLARKGP